jgi:hypothetical protein
MMPDGEWIAGGSPVNDSETRAFATLRSELGRSRERFAVVINIRLLSGRGDFFEYDAIVVGESMVFVIEVQAVAGSSASTIAGSSMTIRPSRIQAEAPLPELDAALLDRLFEAIRRGGSSGITAALLEPTAGGDRELLRRALEPLRTDGRIEPHGRRRGTRYRLAENRLL